MEESQPPTTKRNCIPDSVNQTEMSNWRQTLVMVVALALLALVVAITVDQALGKKSPPTQCVGTGARSHKEGGNRPFTKATKVLPHHALMMIILSVHLFLFPPTSFATSTI